MGNDKLVSIEELKRMTRMARMKSDKQKTMEKLKELYHEKPIDKKYGVTLLMFDGQKLFTADNINELANILEVNGLLKVQKFQQMSEYNKKDLTVTILMKKYTYIDKHSDYYTESEGVR